MTVRLSIDGPVLALFLCACLYLAGASWLRDHPEHDPDAPLSLSDPVGWATARKLAALREDGALCRDFLRRSDIAFTAYDPVGEGTCRRADRLSVANDRTRGQALRPAGAQATCPVQAGLALWLRRAVQPAAQATLGSRVVGLRHLGTYSCRRIGGGEEGRWSEHATGNAIDIAAFDLADGRTVRVLQDWDGEADKAAFLHRVRDDACTWFGTALSPDYNRAHADHLHLDQAARGFGTGYCR